MISSRDRESVYEALNVSNYLKQCDFTIQVLIFFKNFFSYINYIACMK